MTRYEVASTRSARGRRALFPLAVLMTAAMFALLGNGFDSAADPALANDRDLHPLLTAGTGLLVHQGGTTATTTLEITSPTGPAFGNLLVVIASATPPFGYTLQPGINIDSVTQTAGPTSTPACAPLGTTDVFCFFSPQMPPGSSITLTIVISFDVALPSGTNFALQFDAINLSGGGGAGSVFDEYVIGEADLGDAPDPTYPTLGASNGALHVLDGVTFLGASVDAELDGQPNGTATGDDLDGNDDDDGVTFTSSIVQCFPTTLSVEASVAGLLNAWLDFDGDGSWEGPGEQIFTDTPLAPGSNPLTFVVPCGAVPGETFARFRMDTGGGLSPTGLAIDGEVEDYQVTTEADPDPAVVVVPPPVPPPGPGPRRGAIANPPPGEVSFEALIFDFPTDTHTATVNWGDGSPPEVLVVDQGAHSAALSHTYAASGSYGVVVTVEDARGGTGLGLKTVTINVGDAGSGGGPRRTR